MTRVQFNKECILSIIIKQSSTTWPWMATKAGETSREKWNIFYIWVYWLDPFGWDIMKTIKTPCYRYCLPLPAQHYAVLHNCCSWCCRNFIYYQFDHLLSEIISKIAWFTSTIISPQWKVVLCCELFHILTPIMMLWIISSK